MHDHARDKECVERALAGDAGARERLLRRLGKVLPILRLRNGRDGPPLGVEELEDAAQNVLLRVWDKLGEFEGRSSFDTWVYGFCIKELHKARERRRRDAAEPLPDEEAGGLPAPEAVAIDFMQLERIETHLLRLGEEAGELIRRKLKDGETFADIARAKGCSQNTVKTRYYRAIRRLQDLLGADRRRDEE